MDKITEGYKVFDYDWTCKGKDYKGVGAITEQKGDLKICENGIHFCKTLNDTLLHYPLSLFYKYAKIEAYGDIKEDIGKTKFCASKIKIIRELTIMEIRHILTLEQEKCQINLLIRDKELDPMNLIFNGEGVFASVFVSSANGVRYSRNIIDSNSIDQSYNVFQSNSVRNSNNISCCVSIQGSENLLHCSSVLNCSNAYSSLGIGYSSGIYNSYCVYNSYNIINSSCATKCYGIKDCNAISRSIFCSNISGDLMIFNKKVSEERFETVWNKLVSMGFTIPCTNFTKLTIKAKKYDCATLPIDKLTGTSEYELWNTIPEELVEYIKSLPEFDHNIFYNMTR